MHITISGLIFHASKSLPTSALILIYNALAHSKLVYCIEAWGNAPMTHLNKVFIIQKRIIRTIFKKPPREHSSPYFRLANILPVPLLYKHRICLLAHNKFHHQNLSSINYQYNTRKCPFELTIPTFTSAAGQRQPDYQASVAWNQLPVDFRKIIHTFKTVLKQHLLSGLA